MLEFFITDHICKTTGISLYNEKKGKFCKKYRQLSVK